ncbi:hypothetical protein LXL04_029851 [Taraxacum kok-saghyz]
MVVKRSGGDITLPGVSLDTPNFKKIPKKNLLYLPSRRLISQILRSRNLSDPPPLLSASSDLRSQLPVIVRSLDDKRFEGNPRIAISASGDRHDLPLDFLWQSFFEVSLISFLELLTPSCFELISFLFHLDKSMEPVKLKSVLQPVKLKSVLLPAKLKFEVGVATCESEICCEPEHCCLYLLRSPTVVMLQVDWGESTMIEAERLLLQSALENPANQRFILLSDRLYSCYKNLQQMTILPFFTANDHFTLLHMYVLNVIFFSGYPYLSILPPPLLERQEEIRY